jgi:hypothetical protein
MIKINLLPPELRKRTTSINPMVLLVAAEVAVCILALLFGAYVSWVKIPQAQVISDKKDQELIDKTAQAASVIETQGKITAYQETQTQLHALLDKKVYWAHTLDDFVTLLASNFPGGFTVRCLGLTITPLAAPATTDRHSDNTMFSFRGKFQLIGDQGKAGEYIKSMFKQFANSTFWKLHNFQGKPEETYFGDTPRIDAAIGKVIIPFDLEFQRMHVVKKAGG